MDRSRSHSSRKKTAATPSTSMAAFVSPLPLPSGRRGLTQGHPKKSGVRASAMKGGSGSGMGGAGGDSASDHVDGLSESRRALEKSMNLELKPAEGRNGQCKCIWCDGTKERRCSWCNGTGVRYEIVAKSWDELKKDLEMMQSGQPQSAWEPQKVPVRCSACSGTKKLRCAYCRGSGIGSYGHAY